MRVGTETWGQERAQGDEDEVGAGMKTWLSVWHMQGAQGGDSQGGDTQECPQPTHCPHSTGPGCWRDQLPPSRILEHFAHTRGLPAPEFSAEGTTVTFGDQTILLSQFGGWGFGWGHGGARSCPLV